MIRYWKKYRIDLMSKNEVWFNTEKERSDSVPKHVRVDSAPKHVRTVSVLGESIERDREKAMTDVSRRRKRRKMRHGSVPCL